MGEAIKFGRGKIELYKPKFADNDWSKIISACQSGKVPDTWKVGDQKMMTIGGTDYAIDIVGKDHDDYADGSGKAPLTFQFHDCYNYEAKINTTGDNSCGWAKAPIRTGTDTGSMNFILSYMPNEVQSAVRLVHKKTSSGGNSSAIVTTEDKLFLLSEIEAAGTTNFSFPGEGSLYEYYSANTNAIRQKKLRGSNFDWWLRSPRSGAYNSFACISNQGTRNSIGANYDGGIAPAFCF